MEPVGGLRRTSTPVDHLVAEMAAVPLASVASLDLAITSLSKRLDAKDHGTSATPLRRWHEQRSGGQATAALWRAAERDLLHAFPAVSLDELVAIRDEIWFERLPGVAEQERIPIGDYLRELSATFLAPEGPSLRPILPPGHLGRPDRPPTAAESRRTLRWLVMALPPDLLCAAAATGDDALELALTNPTLDRMLRDGGFAETHLHLGAALTFDTIWHALVARVGTLRSDAFASPGAELDEGRDLAPWLVRAALIRLVLARYLRSVAVHTTARSRDPEGFHAYLADGGTWRDMTGSVEAATVAAAEAAYADLRRGSIRDSPVSFAMVQSAYRSMVEPPPTSLVNTRAQIEALDPLAQIFAVPTSVRSHERQWEREAHSSGHRASPNGQWGHSTRTPEQRFVGKGLRYIHQHPEDTAFIEAFWQVVRVRCLVYRHIVQRPMTPGLQWFVRFYDRATPGKAGLGWAAYLDSAAELDGLHRGLRSLEVRRSPLGTVTEDLELACATAEWVRGTAEPVPMAWDQRRNDPPSARSSDRGPADHTHAPLEVGVVLHFSKLRGGGSEQGLPNGFWLDTNADPDLRREELGAPPPANPSGMRYATFYMGMRRSAVALARTLQRWPRSLYVFRALDVCTDELGVPSWVVRPLLDRVRSAAALATTALDRLGEGHAPELHSTVHAGEDFVHLATGLRNVDEAIEHLGIREGDRLGHGMALGVDATAWATQIGRVAIQREVRMWDLVWEWSWIAKEGGGSVARHAFIERELSRLTEEIFGHVVAPFALEHLRSDLVDGYKLWEVGWPEGTRVWASGQRFRDHTQGSLSDREHRLALVHRYLTDPHVFRRGRKVEFIDPWSEAEAIEHLQEGLRHKVASMGITVEINPTSNLLIGDLASLTSHPMWRLDPPEGSLDVQPVAICVGSDDPLTFASSLIEEYNVLYDAMMAAGLTDAHAREWLERVRRRGLEARFTRDPHEVQPITELPNPLRDYPSQLV